MTTFFAPDDRGGGPPDKASEDAYLSKLAESVLKKQSPKQSGEWQRLAATPSKSAAPKDATPPPVSSRPESARSSSSEFPRPPASRLDDMPRNSGIIPRPTISQLDESDPPPSAIGRDGTFAVGTILLFEEGGIGIYRDTVTGKEYEMVYMLEKNGSLKAQGIVMAAYELKVIGKIPPEFMIRLNRRQRWDRDEIIYHLSSFDYCKLIPAPDESFSPTATQSSAFFKKMLAENEKSGKKLARGVRIKINFGNSEWFAVYWGEDELGTVVAHDTHNKWTLMHLDLKRFRDSLVLMETVDNETLRSIEQHITKG